MTRLEGKVALISGAARGQGRAHAIRLAKEGADIIAFDVCQPLPTIQYPLATPEDLAVTAREVGKLGRRILTFEADVRDLKALNQIVGTGVRELGRLDIVCANAGTVNYATNGWALDEEAWDESIGINLTGVWKTLKASIPAMIEAGNGGSIIITSSLAGLKGWPRLASYAAAKHGVVGLMRTLAIELAQYSIRVNTVHPGNTQTPMVDGIRELFAHESSGANMQNLLPVELLEAEDIANAVLWLASDETRYVTGISVPVDAGFLQM
ncbi:mycofactocin-coupled SDR family oxidoreductase [Amycolatopsis pithecellobii]|uniref:Mycofactocin-coupled SDR family oxidoreductase n=1 Tax=Amycolatopsis pithecellobii TaxID=664692 RepID=A0A6N7YZM0_9PSEU|nr:mycofactocin-coupled SDR family oxidoreductase [Amycolatopsis pithecellobii]MTD52921.1 mycofactocin-coupled SDR family oxidoreductase [Amycolatopsis pithecellobii]